MTRITQLTEEQEKSLVDYRDKWLKIGLSTDSGDHTKAEAAVNEAYKVAGLTVPEQMFWLGSPMQGAIAAAIMSQLATPEHDHFAQDLEACCYLYAAKRIRGLEVKGTVSGELWMQSINKLRSSVKFDIQTKVKQEVEKELAENTKQEDNPRDSDLNDKVHRRMVAGMVNGVWKSLTEQVAGNAILKIGNNVNAESISDKDIEKELKAVQKKFGHVDTSPEKITLEMGDIFKKAVEDAGNQAYKCGYGSHDANWLGFYNFFDDHFQLAEKLRPLMALAEDCGWWWPFEGIAILTEKPAYLTRDEEHRLHNEQRKSIEYPDGWGIYCWHGVRMPSDIYEVEGAFTKERILQEENQEVRRSMIEMYTWDKFLEGEDTTIIQSDERGELLEVVGLNNYISGEEERARFVKVQDPSTDRKYALRVPPEIETATEAVAWTFQMSADQYKPLKES